MTDEKKTPTEFFDEELSDEKLEEANLRFERYGLEECPEAHRNWEIACSLRRAVGLPHSDTPIIEARRYGSFNTMAMVVFMVLEGEEKPERDDPKSASNKLSKLNSCLRDLKRQILSLDEYTVSGIDAYGEPHDEYTSAERSDWRNSPYYLETIEGVLKYIDQLEVGVTDTLKEFVNPVRYRKDMGQLRTFAAKQVALRVAEFMHTVTGNIPGFWSGESPSGPYPKAVLEIYGLLGIPPGSFQRAGEWAIAKLKSRVES